MAPQHPANNPVARGPRVVRPPQGPALDAQRGDVGALLLLRDASHPAVLHRRHRRQRRPGAEQELRRGHPCRLQRGRLPAGHPRGHFRRSHHRAMAVHPLRRAGHHGGPHLPVDPGVCLFLARHRPGRGGDRLHQTESVDDRRRPVRRKRSQARRRIPAVLHVDQRRVAGLSPSDRLAARALRVPRGIRLRGHRHGIRAGRLRLRTPPALSLRLHRPQPDPPPGGGGAASSPWPRRSRSRERQRWSRSCTA